MPEVVARLDRVTKAYPLGAERVRLRALLPGPRGEVTRARTFNALEDLSLEVRAGDAVGLIGDNGAGKSTAVKLLAGVIEPSKGRVEVHGRIAPLIELGVGFNAELNGAENLFFGGALLGLTAADVRSRFDDIVAFAGLEAYLDMPVKHYSTGMLARLGFALASSIDADLVLIDEVLSVGDVSFQRRSFERIRELHRDGAALVLVSHNLWMMGQLCDRLVLLESGRAVAEGDPATVLDAYLPPDYFPEPSPTEATLRLATYEVGPVGDACSILHLEVDPPTVEPGGPVVLRATVEVVEPLAAIPTLSVFTSERAVFADGEVGPEHLLARPGRWDLEVAVERFPLSSGRYQFRLALMPEGLEDHEQRGTGALAQATAELVVAGPLTVRPGLKLDLSWSAAAAEDRSVRARPGGAKG